MKKKILSVLLLSSMVFLSEGSKGDDATKAAEISKIKNELDILEQKLNLLKNNYGIEFKEQTAKSEKVENVDKISFSIDATARWFCNGSASAYAISMPSTTRVGDPITNNSQITSNILNSKIKFSKKIKTDDNLSITPYFELGINETAGEEAKSNGHLLKVRHLGVILSKECGNKTHGLNIGQTSSAFAPRLPGQMLCPIRQMLLHYSLTQGNLKDNNYTQLLVGLENPESDGAVSSIVNGKRKLEDFTTAQGTGSGLDLLFPDVVAKYSYNNFEIRGLLRMIGYNPKNSSKSEYTVGGGIGVGYNFNITSDWSVYVDGNVGVAAARYMSNLVNHSMLIKDDAKVESLRHAEIYFNSQYKSNGIGFGFEGVFTRYFYPESFSTEHPDLKKYSLGSGVTLSTDINAYVSPYVGFYYCMAFDHNKNIGYNPALHVGLKLNV